ncbi:dihydrofolate synthase / folylpolyglutamate synthase [Maribacter sedimenticola]|uniref:Dihydrofolate synthase/folylpolyglutamate synthase n=1 Tax=Maribacter sedimenticola TaxID=228956 RepID=A0ABY1SMB9_9FLAO|nr:folylpolyglutamate synthase/dihydrofolate synthase family protein [Maribacter sedimenticola]SNR81153.1 dihydrofolate synthase / folylpolyglutamate synthase [Maribacter sedimenticola]
MTYKNTLSWMFAQLPMYQNKGKDAFNAKLDGIRNLTGYLGNPQVKFKSIHVAGTNGKGSSSHMLASVLQEAGYKVGLYTSPHLKDFRERIRINGRKIKKTEVVRFIEENKGFFNENKFSFFEMTVGMAFSHFANKKVDIAIIEVGLGGRLDSTNIITPEVSLITNIGFDHTDMLGDTLAKIAFEKAGIIKNNVPVVISEYNKETAPVFIERAKKMNAEITFAEKESFSSYEVGLLGNYQQKNSKGVLATLEKLKKFPVDESHIVSGLKNVVVNTKLMGRWQQLGEHPTIICDTAHNKEGLAIVLKQIQKQQYEKLHIVLGFVKDKDVRGIMGLFPKDALYYFTRPKIARGLDENQLTTLFLEAGFHGKAYKTVNKAFKAAQKHAKKSDFIYVGGSNFIVAEVL